MASLGALGDLVLALSADTAKFESDLGKAARVAEKELQKVIVIGSAAGTAIADGLVKAAKALFDFGTDTVRFQAKLDDLADSVGGNVTQLDGLRRVAAISGSDINQVANSLTTLSRTLRASSDDTNSAVRAVRALGLDLEKLRQLSPADAMLEIAKAMARFADGGEKAAVAQALFKGSAKEVLPLLKDLAEAGEINGRVTREQAEQSERLEKETRRLKLAFSDTRDDLANKVIPVFGDYLEQLREGVRIAGGFGESLRLFGTINPFRSTGGNIQKLTQDLEEFKKARDDFAGKDGYEQQVQSLNRAITDTEKRLEFLKFQQRQEALRLAGSDSLDARDMRGRQLPQLEFVATDPEEERKRRQAAAKAQRDAELFAKQTEESAEQEAKTLSEAAALTSAFRQRETEQMRKFRALDLQETDNYYEVGGDALITANEERIRILIERYDREQELAIQNGAAIIEASKRETKELNDITKSLGFTFQSAFEDAVVEGRNLSDVLKALEQDIARIILRMTVTKPLSEGLAGLFARGLSSFSSTEGPEQIGGPVEARAFGGPVLGGMPYMVGERGPEIFVPDMSGSIVPNHAVGGPTIVQHIRVDARSDLASVQRAARTGADMALAEVRNRQQRTGESRV